MSTATESSNQTAAVNAENWRGHEEQLNQMFSLYHETVNPLISVYNALEGKFPVGVMNELRAAFSHMTQSLLEEDSGEVGRHLDRARRHVKRSAVDAYKYAAQAYSRVYGDFRESYRNVDLSSVDNFQFLPRLTRLKTRAGQLIHEAKMVESGVHTDDEMYDAYEAAFNGYAELYECIVGALDAVETVSLKAAEDEAAREKNRRTDRLIGIAGFLVGVAGVAVGIVGLMA
ncbi:hypothetical protein [uncultured Oscillibacter sp.]|uniref:hypothetical protein n=2 Tax=uncultured Oscillibacter sp. TaxID=876091 RepID=UPI00261B2B0D|nr:hypothetical protein [uncultured Oscillibacter sp.]